MRAAVSSELERVLARRSTWIVFAGCIVLSAFTSWGFSIVALNVQGDEGGVSAQDALNLLPWGAGTAMQ
jgi:hypothetical protein